MPWISKLIKFSSRYKIMFTENQIWSFYPSEDAAFFKNQTVFFPQSDCALIIRFSKTYLLYIYKNRRAVEWLNVFQSSWKISTYFEIEAFTCYPQCSGRTLSLKGKTSNSQNAQKSCRALQKLLQTARVSLDVYGAYLFCSYCCQGNNFLDK